MRYQQLFYEEVQEYFEESILKEPKKTVELEHGGVAIREYYITEDTDWFCKKKKWKKLTSLGVVHKKPEKSDGTKEEEWRY